jgi:exodeoxyribonuclease VII small subunit
MAKTKQQQPKSFEEAVTELESILSEMERGEVPLEESLTRYERGNYLLQHCRQVLAKAEQQIEELSKAGEGAAGDPAQTRPAADEIDDANEEGTPDE